MSSGRVVLDRRRASFQTGGAEECAVVLLAGRWANLRVEVA
jgi:hypothetical protein